MYYWKPASCIAEGECGDLLIKPNSGHAYTHCKRVLTIPEIFRSKNQCMGAFWRMGNREFSSLFCDNGPENPCTNILQSAKSANHRLSMLNASFLPKVSY